MEITAGYKTYDYFTYCDYRNSVKTKKWVTARNLDRSIQHIYRSLDALLFGSQYYYIISISSWGLIFLYLGFTSLVENKHNFFDDPVTVFWVIIIVGGSFPVKYLLAKVSNYIGIWKVTANDRVVVDIGTINRLDQANNIKRLVKNV